MRLIRLTFVFYGKLLVYESNEELAAYRYEYTGTRGEWKQSFVALRSLRGYSPFRVLTSPLRKGRVREGFLVRPSPQATPHS
jgi:hypothetical protein